MPDSASRRPLVIGYGNPLRQDDGVGWHAAAMLRADPRFAGCDVRQEIQLHVEMAVDVAASACVVFIDARDCDAPAGHVEVRRVGDEDQANGFSSHHVGPELVLGLAQRLYGRRPTAVVIEVAAHDFDAGVDSLTTPVAQALPAVSDAVAALVSDGIAHPAG